MICDPSRPLLLTVRVFCSDRYRPTRFGQKEKDRINGKKDEEMKREKRTRGIFQATEYCDIVIGPQCTHRHTYSVHTTALSGLCFIIARSRVASRMMILSTGIILLCSSESCSMEEYGVWTIPEMSEQTRTNRNYCWHHSASQFVFCVSQARERFLLVQAKSTGGW